MPSFSLKSLTASRDSCLLLVGRVLHQTPGSYLSSLSVFPSCPTLYPLPRQCLCSGCLLLSNDSKPQSFKITFFFVIMILRVSIWGSDQLPFHFALTGITQWYPAEGRYYLDGLRTLLLLPLEGLAGRPDSTVSSPSPPSLIKTAASLHVVSSTGQSNLLMTS